MDPMDVAEADAASETALNTKPRQPLPAICFACGAEVRGPYCYQCGQKNDDCRRSIFRLCGESLNDFFAFDGRALRTVRSVATRPGRHVREYGDGRRSPYSPPIRFFLVVSLIFFSVLTVSGTQLMTLRPVVEVDQNGAAEGVTINPTFLEPRTVKPFTEEEREYIIGTIGLDEVENAEEDIIDVNGRSMSPQDLFDRFLKVTENPTAFNAALNSSIPKLMIVLIPLLALMGAVFIRGKNAMIYDHLLLALNTHAMMFIVLTLAVIGSLALPFIERHIYAWIFFLGIPVYYFAAVKGAFRRGWIKTIFSVLVTLFFYALAMIVGLTIVTGISIWGVL